MIKDIYTQIELIDNSLDWSKRFKVDTFPAEELKEIRRQLRRIANSLKDNCSAAAYGESQVGKSYLMSSLLSTAKSPFLINNKGVNYNFIYDINPSGGDNTKTESTGVITRFTINPGNTKMKDYVKVKNLSIADLLMLLIDSYYNDLQIDTNKILNYEAINTELRLLQASWIDNEDFTQSDLVEDDIKDICDYITEVIGSNAVSIQQSDFKKIISANIKFLDYTQWESVFSLLWNKNQEISKLFSFLITEFKQISFQTEVYVPFDSVLQAKGTLLKIEWLDSVCGLEHKTKTDELYTKVYDVDGNVLAHSFKKSSLSALIAELTFILPESIAEERPFLKRIDLLDFPGARARERINEDEVQAVLPTILRRGKVAYLFNKYARSLSISSILFCHHNDQKNEPSLGNTITDWIESNIGKTPEERAQFLAETSQVSPLFFIATKFNIELQKTRNDLPNNPQSLNEHWKRFKTTIPEIIKPAKWFNYWVPQSGIPNSYQAFQHIYLLRDFYWSGQNRVFDGYNDHIGENSSPELNIHIHKDYPNYFDDLRHSFLQNDFVKKHFSKPQQAWDNVATLNNDGSKAIIEDLNLISTVLDQARTNRYLKLLKQLQKEVIAKLSTYYEPEDQEQNNLRVRNIAGTIRRQLDLSIGERPEIFGKIIDEIMLPVRDLRKIAYDIVTLKTETPRDFNEIILIRTMVSINLNEDKSTNIQKLCNYYACNIEDLEKDFKKKGFTVDDVISTECNVPTTVADVVTNKILDYWVSFINRQVKKLELYLPYSDEVAFMLQVLCKKLNIHKILSNKIDRYTRDFPESDLPNVIADFASLTLNNFVSTVGREYLTAEDVKSIKDKADACKLLIDLSPEASSLPYKRIKVKEALQAFDDAADPNSVSIETLIKLPFWDNFQRWKNLLVMGLLFASDVSQCDPVANDLIKDIITKYKSIY